MLELGWRLTTQGGHGEGVRPGHTVSVAGVSGHVGTGVGQVVDLANVSVTTQVATGGKGGAGSVRSVDEVGGSAGLGRVSSTRRVASDTGTSL